MAGPFVPLSHWFVPVEEESRLKRLRQVHWQEEEEEGLALPPLRLARRKLEESLGAHVEVEQDLHQFGMVAVVVVIGLMVAVDVEQVIDF